MHEDPPAQRIFTIISAIHNVSPYLNQFLESIERQTYGMENLDLILIDDGSTDDSLSVCESFAARWPRSVHVLHQKNSGQGSARNSGLAHSRGEWVTFTDPDDFLAFTYFSEISSFIDSFEENDGTPQIVSSSLRVFLEASGEYRDDHPLQAKFSRGNRVIDLAVDSDCIQMHCSSALFRRSIIDQHALRFDERIRPTFEDSHFIASYLLLTDFPHLGVVATALYFYRKRADASSSIELSGSNPAKYELVPRLGHLAILQAARSHLNSIPVWLQNMVLYDLAWYLKTDAEVVSPTAGLATSVLEEFHKLLGRILQLISADTIEWFSILPISDDIRFVLMHGWRRENYLPSTVILSDVDPAQKLIKLTYRFTGPSPADDFQVDGNKVLAVHAKIRSIEFYQRTLGLERIVWIPYGQRTRVALNGLLTSITSRHERTTDVLDERAIGAFQALRVLPAAFRHP
jgi:glycosyltransferase involved in cell wall biosynthesis